MTLFCVAQHARREPRGGWVVPAEDAPNFPALPWVAKSAGRATPVLTRRVPDALPCGDTPIFHTLCARDASLDTVCVRHLAHLSAWPGVDNSD